MSVSKRQNAKLCNHPHYLSPSDLIDILSSELLTQGIHKLYVVLKGSNRVVLVITKAGNSSQGKIPDPAKRKILLPSY